MSAQRSLTALVLLPLAVAGSLVLLVVLRGDVWLLLLAGAAVGVDVAALALPPRIEDLAVSVTGPVRVVAGRESSCTVRVTNTGTRTTSLAQALVQEAGMSDVVLVVEALPPGGTADYDVLRTVLARGRSQCCEVTLTSSAPFGVVRSSRRLAAPRLLIAHPAPVPVLAPPWRGSGEQHDRARPSRAGTQVHGVRDWRSGDDSRRVHWRATARHGRVMVVEREQPVGGRCTVLLPGRPGPGGPEWEAFLARVAAATVLLVADGAAVVLVADQPGLDAATASTATAVLDWFSRLDATRDPGGSAWHRAVGLTGRGGMVLVAGGADPGAAGWAAARARCSAAGVGLAPLVVQGRR